MRLLYRLAFQVDHYKFFCWFGGEGILEMASSYESES